MADQQYDNTNRGAMFPAREKRSDRSPDYNGKLNINGEEFWISAWVRDGRSGEFLSLSLGEKVEAREGQSNRAATNAPRTLSRPNGGGSSSAGGASRPTTPAHDKEWEDDIPF